MENRESGPGAPDSSVPEYGPVAPRVQGAEIPTGAGETNELNTIASLLASVKSQLVAIEGMVERTAPAKGKGPVEIALDFLRIIFGGWAAVALFAIVLFHTPIRASLDLLPGKLKNANEFQVGVVSFKTTIENEALRVGAVELSKTIPNLSSPAIDLLLQAPRKPDQKSLVSYTPNSKGDYEQVSFPSASLIKSLSELEGAGLAQILEFPASAPPRTTTIDEFMMHEEDFRRKYPGRIQSESWDSAGQSWWKPTVPAPKGSLPITYWSLTEKGTQAVSIILKSVAAELAQKASSKE